LGGLCCVALRHPCGAFGRRSSAQANVCFLVSLVRAAGLHTTHLVPGSLTVPIAGVLGGGALAASLIGSGVLYRLALANAATFAVAAAASRTLAPLIESRIHLLWFWLSAVVVEILALPLGHQQPSGRRLVINGLAATVAILAARWAVEGPPWFNPR